MIGRAAILGDILAHEIGHLLGCSSVLAKDHARFGLSLRRGERWRRLHVAFIVPLAGRPLPSIELLWTSLQSGTPIRASGAARYAELLAAAAASIRHGILTWRVICPFASQ